MALVLPSTVSNPTTGQPILAAWGDAVNDVAAYLSTNKPHAKLTRTSAQAITTGTWTAISFTTEDYDVGGCHSTASNQSRFTVPSGEGGKYLFTADVKFVSSAAGTGRLGRFKVNGTTTYLGTDQGLASGTYLGYINCSSGPVALAAGDYVEFEVFQDSGGSLNTTVTDGQSHMTGSWYAA